MNAPLSRKGLAVDWYLVLLLVMVALGLLVPARGAWRPAVDGLSYWAVWLLFFLYGARLSMRAVWEGLTHWRLQGLVLASTFLLMPMLGLAAAKLSARALPAELATGLIFLGLLPSTVQSSIAFTSMARGNVAAALCAASVSNLLGVVLTPVLASAALGASQGLSATGLEAIAMQLLLPFALGQLARARLAGWLQKHRIVTMICDRGSILLIVYSAFSAGTVEGVWTRVSASDLLLLLAVSVAMLAAVLLITTLASRRLGFSRADEIAIVFCGSKKSLATGLPLARILFAGPQLGLIVLPMMLFHQVQLLVCANLARRYAARAGEE